jgi:hypothetical protein
MKRGNPMKKTLFTMLFLTVLSSVAFAKAPNSALSTHHTIKASASPFKAVGHAFVKTVTGAAAFSFEAFDSTVVDPFGVALQAFADGIDMAIAAPLEALPKPLNEIGVGVHYIYLGLDIAGTQLAK